MTKFTSYKSEKNTAIQYILRLGLALLTETLKSLVSFHIEVDFLLSSMHFCKATEDMSQRCAFTL